MSSRANPLLRAPSLHSDLSAPATDFSSRQRGITVAAFQEPFSLVPISAVGLGLLLSGHHVWQHASVHGLETVHVFPHPMAVGYLSSGAACCKPGLCMEESL